MWGWEVLSPWESPALTQESFLSEPVASDRPLKWCWRLLWSFPFCWAHTDVVNPLQLQELASLLILQGIPWWFIFWVGLCFPNSSMPFIIWLSRRITFIRSFGNILVDIFILGSATNMTVLFFFSFFICSVNILLLLIIKVLVEKLEITQSTQTHKENKILL